MRCRRWCGILPPRSVRLAAARNRCSTERMPTFRLRPLGTYRRLLHRKTGTGSSGVSQARVSFSTNAGVKPAQCACCDVRSSCRSAAACFLMGDHAFGQASAGMFHQPAPFQPETFGEGQAMFVRRPADVLSLPATSGKVSRQATDFPSPAMVPILRS